MMRVVEKLVRRQRHTGATPPVVIACLGDSVTHGSFEVFINRFGHLDAVFDPDNAYASRLQRRLNAYYPAAAVSVINAGVGGDNAPGGLARLERDVLHFRPDLVIVNFALNDAMGGLDKLDAYAQAMEAIMRRVADSGAECMLLTPNRMCTYVSHNIHDDIIRRIASAAAEVQIKGVLDAYVNAARSIADQNRVPVADAYAAWNRLEDNGIDTTAMLANHINHPVPDMHRLFVDAIESRLFESAPT